MGGVTAPSTRSATGTSRMQRAEHAPAGQRRHSHRALAAGQDQAAAPRGWDRPPAPGSHDRAAVGPRPGLARPGPNLAPPGPALAPPRPGPGIAPSWPGPAARIDPALRLGRATRPDRAARPGPATRPDRAAGRTDRRNPLRSDRNGRRAAARRGIARLGSEKLSG